MDAVRDNGAAPRSPGVPHPAADAADLRAFVAVARLGTVSAAALALGRTQPSLSARLASLEGAWQTRLFRRQARGMSLTPEGARLLPMAEAALRGLEELDRAAGLPLSAARELRLGAGDALGREILPEALSILVREDPALSVRLVEGSAPRLLEALRGGEIDVAFAALPEPAQVGDGLATEYLLESAVDLLLPTGSSPASRRPVPVEALAGRRLVCLQSGSAFRRHVETALAARGVPFVPAVEVGNLSLVRRFVAAGLGAAPVPAVAFSERAPGPPVERRALSGIGPIRYRVLRRAGAPPSLAAERLVALLRSGSGGTVSRSRRRAP